MMAMKKYKLSKLLEGLEMVSTDCNIYMNKSTGEFLMITDELMRTYEKYNDGSIDGILEWEKNMVDEIREVVDIHPDDYIELPTSYELHEHKIMENFCYTLQDSLKDEFLHAIFKKGAFRRFQQLLIHYRLRDQWFEFKRNAYLKKLVSWCESQGVDYE